MRLLTSSKTSADKSSKYDSTSKKSVSTKADVNESENDKSVTKKKSDSEQLAAAVPVSPVDYTRPASTTELLVDLQRRVIHLETQFTRRLTAGEYAIAVGLMTGQSLEKWQSQGYVVEQCPCTNLGCKGWRMVPVGHYRTEPKGQEKNSSPVNVEALTATQEEPLDIVFQQMFKQGKLGKGKNDTTLIPPDGPINWSHREQLAFAAGFEMDDLLKFEGKPRELQRRLIEELRTLGYKVLSAPEK